VDDDQASRLSDNVPPDPTPRVGLFWRADPGHFSKAPKFWVLYKRLERGTFAWPEDEGVGPVELKAVDLMLLLSGVERGVRRRRWYDRVA